MVPISRRRPSPFINANYARLTRETTGHLVSRLTNDLSFIQQAAQVSMVAFVRDGLSVIACVGAMLYIDWMLTLIVLAVFPLAIVPLGSIGRRLRSVAKRTQSELGDMTSRLTGICRDTRLIKPSARELRHPSLNRNFGRSSNQDESRAHTRAHGTVR